MASSTLQKLLRNQTQSASKVFTVFRKPLPPLPPLSRTQIPQIFDTSESDPLPSRPELDYVKLDSSGHAHIYPSFSLGFFLNPISPSTLIRSEPDGEATEDEDESNVIRADSTKKKRKKKMNKHKLKKLRKRLRRKT